MVLCCCGWKNIFWTLFGAEADAEADADMTVLLFTGPVDPLLTLRVLEVWCEEAVSCKRCGGGKEGEVVPQEPTASLKGLQPIRVR